MSVGEITVILPPTVRAEVSGHAKFGDVKIDHMVQGGADIRHERVLEPEVTPDGTVATIVLTVKAGSETWRCGVRRDHTRFRTTVEVRHAT
nr:hypothetical protein GCM10020093_089920 [Planobispora longispora]